MRVYKAFLVVVLMFLCLSGLAAICSAQQPDPTQGAAAAPPAAGRGAAVGRGGLPLVVHPISNAIYWVFGPATSNNSNSGIIVGRTGVILFDTKNTVEDEKTVLAEVANITNKPVTTVVISHNDGDHVNGLPVLPKGVTIISTAYCKKAMQDAIARGGRGAPDPDYLPTKTFDTKESLTVDGVHLQLLHFAPAHTGGDTILYLPDQKIVFMGDIVITEQPLPIMHMDNGGSPQGIVDSIRGMLALNADTYVSGHGPTCTKAELEQRLKTYEDRIVKVKALVTQGKSLAEVKETLGEPVPPPTPAGGRGGGGLGGFTDNIYMELTRK